MTQTPTAYLPSYKQNDTDAFIAAMWATAIIPASTQTEKHDRGE